MMAEKYSILVNTCDMYSDCWDPFFKLFSKYWPDCKARIYLNTEYKDYSFPGLNIQCNKVCMRHGCNPDIQPTWSQRLFWALELIDTKVVLFMQEDFFLYGRVDDNAISKYAQLLISDNIQCLHITPYLNGSAGPSCYDNIDIIKQNYEYRIDCQAAFWNKEVMMSYLDLRETAWEFEKLGSKRASWIHHTFLKIRKSYVQNNPILPYYSTGINKSRWQGGGKKGFRRQWHSHRLFCSRIL